MSTLNVANFDFSQDFNEILKRIALYSPEITKGDSDIARALDVSRTTPSTWRRRGKLPLEAIIDYAKKKELNTHWLLTGEGTPEVSHLSTKAIHQINDGAKAVYLNDDDAAKRVDERNITTKKVIKEVSEYINETLTLDETTKDYELVKTMLFKLGMQTNCELHQLESFIDFINHQSDQDECKDFAMIPGYNVQVSAGHGAINGEQQPTRYLAFRHKWLKYRGFNQKDLVVVFAKGDSMEPTITNNNSLLIKTNVESIQDGGIYVIQQDDTLLVKRVQRLLDGNLKLISDNTAYEPTVLSKDSFESLNVVGQVVWIAKDID